MNLEAHACLTEYKKANKQQYISSSQRKSKEEQTFDPCVGLTLYMISDIYEIITSTHRIVVIYTTKL